MEDIIELSGGPYIVKTNQGGGIEFRYGWSEINIQNGNCIKIICTDDDDYTRIILNFSIKNVIPRDYKTLELIQIYLKNGYNHEVFITEPKEITNQPNNKNLYNITYIERLEIFVY
jgi:hypothetical protein